jgi:snRNA-activating protein complex subunit 3
MESVQDPDSRAWISKKVSVGRYFDEFLALVDEAKPVRNTRDMKERQMRKLLGLGDQHTGDEEADEKTNATKKNNFENVLKVMDINNLDTPGEMEPMQISNPVGDTYGSEVTKFYQTLIPDAALTKLKSSYLQKRWLEISKNNKPSKQRRMNQLKGDNNFWFYAEKPPTDKMNPEMTDRKVLYCVRLYRPYKHLPHINAGNPVLKYTQEIWMLGDHTLADLRDSIKCTVDLNIVGDRQCDGVTTPALRASDAYKSGFIYIEGCFYNDMRHEGNIDYSEVIRKWARDTDRGVGPFTTGSMEETRLQDLEVRLGHPYVYTHQGEHEHLLSFVDIRILGPDDPQRPNDYPMIRSLGAQQSRYCMVCETYIAAWVTKNHQRVPEDPYFWCRSCYKNFNFKDGQKIGTFDSFRFFDVNVL